MGKTEKEVRKGEHVAKTPRVEKNDNRDHRFVFTVTLPIGVEAEKKTR